MYTSDLERTEIIVEVILSGPVELVSELLYDLATIGCGSEAPSCDTYLAHSFPRCHGSERRQLYLLAMVSLAGPECLQAVSSIMRNDPDPTVRLAAIKAAQSYSSNWFRGDLAWLSVMETNAVVRRAADTVLGELFSEE